MPYREVIVHADPHEMSMNAAGIADAFRVLRCANPDDEDRYGVIANDAGGFIGIAEAFSYAGAAMERFRVKVGEDSEWGSDLPHVYVAWSAIAMALWCHWETGPAEIIAERALLHLVMRKEEHKAAWVRRDFELGVREG